MRIIIDFRIVSDKSRRFREVQALPLESSRNLLGTLSQEFLFSETFRFSPGPPKDFRMFGYQMLFPGTIPTLCVDDARESIRPGFGLPAGHAGHFVYHWRGRTRCRCSSSRPTVYATDIKRKKHCSVAKAKNTQPAGPPMKATPTAPPNIPRDSSPQIVVRMVRPLTVRVVVVIIGCSPVRQAGTLRQPRLRGAWQSPFPSLLQVRLRLPPRHPFYRPLS